uniref:Man1/Src1 C-terminal domain-containing protein n=1 Tax=Kwoniella dejecticola CBS 10117 TaxID=1296121 RepID=A0A1A6ADC2_9TREE|nr:uncharacterized protein I303_02261 [Kwoniella dejecticola CBS 10117]OBR88043.1 hypothetical protein I303_02261 [Kwoniella dejecticola CBS 10117]
MAAPTQDVYLAEGFDPNSLRVPQLRSILLEHGHGISSAAKKAELVDAFERHVLPQASALRAKAGKIKPSGKGIVTVSENGDETPAVPAKRPRARTRRKATHEPEEPVIVVEEIIEVDQVPEPEPEPPAKKPRASRARKSVSIEPEKKATKGRARKSAADIVPKLEDVDAGVEGEIEDEATPVSPPLRSRSRASLAPSTPSLSTPATNRRRSAIETSSSANTELRTPSVGPEAAKPPRSAARKSESVKILDHLAEESEKEESPKKAIKPKTPRKSAVAEESGFSDFNPFQSGSEAAAAAERRRRRKSSMGLESSGKPAQPRFSEPAPSTSAPTTPGLRKLGPSREYLRTPPSDVKAAMKRELDAAVEYNQAVEEKLNQITTRDSDEPTRVTVESHLVPVETNSLVRRVESQIAQVPAPRTTIPLSILFLLLLSLLANFKNQSSSLGYCDSASTTNDLILERDSAYQDAQACIARKASLELDDHEAAKAIQCDVSDLPLIPFLPRPTACAPCPPHAECTEGEIMSCIPEYILSPHPLSFLGPVVDGLPGLSPRVFPPSCKPDTAKKRMIGGLVMEMERELSKGRGLLVCNGLGKEDGKKGEGERYGVEENSLRERFAARRDPKFSREQFDEIFESALKDLVEHEDVIESIDIHGKSWYASSRTDLTLGCRAKLEAKDLLDRWKSQIGGTAAVIAIIMALQSEVKKRRAEKYRAEELAQVALKRLQDQEQSHYVDPSLTPNPFIAPDQLRDLVMPPKGSTASRSRLWSKVQDLVEHNANIAVREREVKGEMWKTWEWTGTGSVSDRHVTWEQ